MFTQSWNSLLISQYSPQGKGLTTSPYLPILDTSAHSSDMHSYQIILASTLSTCCAYFVYILFVCIIVCPFVYLVVFVLCFVFFVDLPSVLWYCWLGLLTCKNRLPYKLYCVGGDVKHCTIQSSLSFICQWSPREDTPDIRIYHAKFRQNLTLHQFKVIQGHRCWCQSKAHVRLPISH